jgi:hypothetical protein
MCLSVAVHFPDHVLAKGEHLGYEWNVVHNHRAIRCGYVRVPAGHPWHGRSYHELDVECHGGLTFGELDLPCEAPGDDDAYWVGFDCGHCWDLPDPALPVAPEYAAARAYVERMSGLRFFDHGPHSRVCSQEYVEAECLSICEQAAAALKPVESR